MNKNITIPYWNHNTAYFPWIKKQIMDGTSVLDVGCGDGTLVYFLSDKISEADALDEASVCIESAKHKYADISNIHFICGKFEDYKCDKKYDAIIFTASLHHIDLNTAVNKAKFLLHDGGVLLVVGIASPTNIIDWLIEFLRLLPSALISRINQNKNTEELGVPTSYRFNTMHEIRQLVKTELFGAKLRYGLHYRYILKWKKT